MKTKITLLIVACFTALCLSSSMKAIAQNGPNLLINSDFANVTDLATNAYGNTWVWPDDWVLVSDSVIWNQYPIFKIWWQDPDGANIPTIGCWTGVTSSGTMYQDVTGLENGYYEFTFDGAASGAGDSKYAAFLTGFGGDSTSMLMPVTNGFVPLSVGPVKVTNGTCRVGFNIVNGPAGDWNDIMNLDFHSVPAPIVYDTLRGENVLINSDFANVTDLATNVHGFTFVWPDEWVLVSDSAGENHPLWGADGYPVFKVWWQDPEGANIPTLGCWTGVPSEGTMYQDVTGLENGLYEFTFDGAASGAGDSKYYAFLTGYGGDSVSILMPVTNGFVPLTVGPIEVTNGTCRVGLYIKNGPAGDWNDIMNLSFHNLTLTPQTALPTLETAKVSAYAYHGQLNVRVNDAEIQGVEVYNVIGQKVYSAKGIKTNSFTRSINDKGILLVKVYTSKGIITKKVMNQ